MRVYFPVDFILNPERKKALIGLVMKAIERLQVDATEVFIRADLHDSTSIGGRWVPDANGFHATFSYKTAAMAAESKHVASHAYTFGGGHLLIEGGCRRCSQTRYRVEKEGTCVVAANGGSGRMN